MFSWHDLSCLPIRRFWWEEELYATCYLLERVGFRIDFGIVIKGLA